MRHESPKQDGYSLKDALSKIQRELGRGENVILDTMNLSADHSAELEQAIADNGWSARVVFY